MSITAALIVPFSFGKPLLAFAPCPATNRNIQLLYHQAMVLEYRLADAVDATSYRGLSRGRSSAGRARRSQ